MTANTPAKIIKKGIIIGKINEESIYLKIPAGEKDPQIIDNAPYPTSAIIEPIRTNIMSNFGDIKLFPKMINKKGIEPRIKKIPASIKPVPPLAGPPTTAFSGLSASYNIFISSPREGIKAVE